MDMTNDQAADKEKTWTADRMPAKKFETLLWYGTTSFI